MLLDGFSGHDLGCCDPCGQVKIFCFPPNVTTVFQPLDQGVIAAFKTHFKSRLLEKVVTTASKFDQLQVLAKHLPSGTAGLQYGNPPHVGDAMVLVKEAWSTVLPSVIEACWRHANCLPVTFFSGEGEHHDTVAL